MSIMDKIVESSHAALCQGFVPSEVWLGPGDRDELDEYLDFMLPDEKTVRSYVLKGSALQDGETRIMGMLVRFATNDGVRAGKSFGNP
jgi:hypothetical protein